MSPSGKLELPELSLVGKESYVKAPGTRIPRNPNFTDLLGDTADPRLGGGWEVSKEPFLP